MKIQYVQKLTDEQWMNLYAATYEHNGRSGDISLMLWPVEFTLAYVGYDILTTAHGIGHMPKGRKAPSSMAPTRWPPCSSGSTSRLAGAALPSEELTAR